MCVQGAGVRAEVRGEDSAAGDGPALYHGVQDEDDELPILSGGVPVSIPARPVEGALRGVLEGAFGVCDGGEE